MNAQDAEKAIGKKVRTIYHTRGGKLRAGKFQLGGGTLVRVVDHGGKAMGLFSYPSTLTESGVTSRWVAIADLELDITPLSRFPK